LGHLAACLLLDSAPRRFTSYLLGARFRINFTPYASDLLFRETIPIECCNQHRDSSTVVIPSVRVAHKHSTLRASTVSWITC